MGILSAFLELMTERQPAIRLVPSRCLRSRLHICDCRRCLDVCAAEALVLVGRQIELDSDKCTACMSCAAVCPNDALTGEHDLLSLLDAIVAGPRPVVACSRGMARSRAGLTVPCMGIFPEEALLALGHSGLASIAFAMDECQTCTNNHAAVRFVEMVERLHNRVGRLPTRLDVEGVGDREAGSDPDGRRAYLSHCLTGIAQLPGLRQNSGKSGGVAEAGQRSGGKRVPAKVRIVERLLHSADAGERERLRASACHRLVIDERCTLCRRCSAICPTGALTFRRSEAGDQVVFSPTRCSGCGLCQSFCKEEALQLYPPYRGEDFPDDQVAAEAADHTA